MIIILKLKFFNPIKSTIKIKNFDKISHATRLLFYNRHLDQTVSSIILENDLLALVLPNYPLSKSDRTSTHCNSSFVDEWKFPL